MKLYRYDNLFLYSSFQFSGNIEEYFSKNSKRLVTFIILPRIKNTINYIRVYNNGTLTKEVPVRLSQNIFLYYILWYISYIRCLMFFNRQDKVYVIGMHPITFFGMRMQRLLRNITYVYWICDYFPGNGFIIKLYERLKKYYHDVIPFSCYLSDEINKVYNGKILNTKRRKTIMWGVKPSQMSNRKSTKNFTILFVGVIKEQQGLEYVFNYLKNSKKIKLNVLGVCENSLYKKYKKTIKKLGIQKQVYFPNENVYHEELVRYANESQVGIALYDPGEQNVTFYADPAKIKTYTQLGLPVIMSRISTVAQYIEKFNAGIITERNEVALDSALNKIRKNYDSYLSGVAQFNSYFNYESYYKDKFTFLEK